MNYGYIDLFAEYLGLEDFSDKTIKSYVGALRDFEQWLLRVKAIKDIRIIAFKEIKDYRESLIDKYAPATVNQKLCAIKTFFRFMLERKIIDADPSKNIKIQKISNNIKSQYLTRSETLAIMNRAKLMGKKPYAILMIMLKLGLRPSEVAAIRLNSVHLKSDPTLIIKNSKRNKSRYVPIPPDTVVAIQEWLEIRNASTKVYHQRSDYLFTSERGEQLGVRGIQRIIENIARKEHIKLYCSRLRCTFANDLIQEANIPINILSALLGHENISVTGRYIHASQVDVRKFVDKLSEI